MALPRAHGLYDPAHEHDACGLGFVAELRRGPTHDVVAKALEVLRRLSHRGAAGADPSTGDGAGILLQIPHSFYERVLSHRDMELPLAGDYGVAQCFLSRDAARAEAQMRICEDVVRYHNQKVIGWRDVPVDEGVIGPVARASRPVMKQLFVARMAPAASFERVLFMIRKRAGRLVSTTLGGPSDESDFYIASCSSKTVVYKGLMLPERIDGFYLDLRQDDVKSALAMVHSRFSTNTFPTWDRAHPYRHIAHNGEINTLRGNQNWMGAREPLLASKAFGEHLADFKPIIRPQGSDSASLDNVVDFLVAGGRSLPHVMMMLVPEAWATQADMPTEKRAFYEYHASLVEPWDGPAALVFTDGTLIGATLDRNGLRPAKYVVTEGGMVVLASELGVLDIPAEEIVAKGRLQPGKMFLVDTAKGRIVDDDEVKHAIASRQPYARWIAENKIELSQLPRFDGAESLFSLPAEERARLQRAFGYTREDLRTLLAPMATAGEEPTGSMGNDAALAVLSDRPVSLFRYFKQQFAQVTNPPIDPIREELVMSLVSCVGGEGNLLDETPRQCRLLELPHPVLSNAGLAKFLASDIADFKVARIPITFGVRGDPAEALAEGIEAACAKASKAIDEGASILVLSDRDVDAWHAPIPSLLATSAVHHRLIREGKRVRCGIVVESGEPREVADVALLVGYGAGAVNPYLAFESIHAMIHDGTVAGVDPATADKNYVKALKKGLLKVLSKMGISTIASYHGAQIFEAVGVSKGVVDAYFTGTSSRLGGIGLPEIAREAIARHASGFHRDAKELDVGGVYAWRALEGAERHLWTPQSVASLQKAVRLEDARSYAEYARLINEQSAALTTLRGMWDLRTTDDRAPIAIEEVEPAKEIVKRFATGAMSFGSISREAHETLAVAMNRIGGKSNTGEGGEDEARYVRDAKGDLRRSAIKQVASARFGVTTHYLVNADELQIKMAQGAKPGEGGQLPGHKVSEEIARVRHSTPGVTLISPPPHHDIYSIEDLAQLIFDLKNVSRGRARVSVKLVSESGVGTVAAGVAKANADAILIAGHDGGTGASPLSSIQHAGTPWELGLAEAQQVLVLNGLRSRVVLQVDGQLKTGRDVAIAALLGAEEFGFATAPLVASGCILMRKCHLNTCPVGVATQDPVLRARFQGQPEHVVSYFFFVAEELRAIMAQLGFRTVDEMVGQVGCLTARSPTPGPSPMGQGSGEGSSAPGEPGWGLEKARSLDFSAVLAAPASRDSNDLHCTRKQSDLLAKALDRAVIQRVAATLERGEPTRTRIAITNADRAFGAMLAGEIATRTRGVGLREDAIRIDVTGTAGQSFGAFAVKGTSIALEGDANDYVGKGLSGGVLSIRPPQGARFVADANVIVGNTVLYGATSGRAFFCGRAGERFAVRNSGAQAVVEGVGDHGCEYMTGGVVVVLGTTGRNFAAGMSGGVAYVLDEDGAFAARCNREMVELSPLEEEDENAVHALVAEHVQRTESAKGRAVLAAWPKERARFVKVLPLEYKKVLESMRPRATLAPEAKAAG